MHSPDNTYWRDTRSSSDALTGYFGLASPRRVRTAVLYRSLILGMSFSVTGIISLSDESDAEDICCKLSDRSAIDKEG
jgi:hypothetical protein